MVKKQQIKYDGSESEMLRLGIIDESGNMNVKRRNEYKEYMSMVDAKKLSKQGQDFPDREKLEEYFDNRERRKAKNHAFFSKLFGRKK